MDELQRFSHRLHSDWLVAFCNDDKRKYDPLGFKTTSITVAAADARDCMLAMDLGVVFDTRGGRYRATKSSAHGRGTRPSRRGQSPFGLNQS